jgi:hypothetical protein
MKIFGAGLSGLIAGIANPRAQIYEKNEKGVRGHQALLRFRDTSVSDMTGIKFKKVKVIKSIWFDGRERQPSPRLVAMYSHKNTGHFENRSIMDIKTTERYIAPDNFQDLLIKECEERIFYGYAVDRGSFACDEDIISTLPLSFNAHMLGYKFDTSKSKSKIHVTRILIEDCDMYTTVYYPDNNTSVYRASVTGQTLIIESKEWIQEHDISLVIDSMGLSHASFNIVLDNHVQPMGKLSEVNDSERRMMIYQMSHDHGVFSLGRFALHKNILLDDVAKDIRVIKSMMADDSYGISTMGRV